MPTPGEKAVLLTDSEGISATGPVAGEQGVLYDVDDSRGASTGESGIPAMLVEDGLAQASSTTGIIYYVDQYSGNWDPTENVTPKVYKLDSTDFSILASFDIEVSPHGAGGDSNIAWVGDHNDRLTALKRESTNLSAIDSGPLPFEHTELGGDIDVIYAAFNQADKIGKIDGETFAEKRSVDVGYNPTGAGGSTEVAYFSGVEDPNGDRRGVIQKRDATDLSLIKSQTYGSDTVPTGCGGSSRVLFSVDQPTDSRRSQIHRHDPKTLDIVDSKLIDFGTGDAFGVGGY